MTTRGATASLTAIRWRRYSGLTHTPKSGPAWSPAFVSSNGMTRSSVVPGGTVLRMITTRYRPGSENEALPSASPMVATAASSGRRSTPPSAVGVETETSTTSMSERSMPFTGTVRRPWARRSASTASSMSLNATRCPSSCSAVPSAWPTTPAPTVSTWNRSNGDSGLSGMVSGTIMRSRQPPSPPVGTAALGTWSSASGEPMARPKGRQGEDHRTRCLRRRLA